MYLTASIACKEVPVAPVVCVVVAKQRCENAVDTWVIQQRAQRRVLIDERAEPCAPSVIVDHPWTPVSESWTSREPARVDLPHLRECLRDAVNSVRHQTR